MIVQGWVDWARRLPGIADKVYTETNRGEGLIGHSIVGSMAGALGRFLSVARDEAGRYTPQAAASVMFIVTKDGTLVQMYPTWASTWTSGGREANTKYWAIELEGGPPGNEGEPMTPLQLDTLLRLCEEWEDLTGRECVPGVSFVEHGAIAAQLGYGATACPSNRYAPLYEALGARKVTGMEDKDARKAVAELNRALVRREALRMLASDPDLSKVDQAVTELQLSGLIRRDI